MEKLKILLLENSELSPIFNLNGIGKSKYGPSETHGVRLNAILPGVIHYIFL